MVIKIACISASHGVNAITYAMEKNRDTPPGKPADVEPVFLSSNHLPVDDITGEPITADDVWLAMKLRNENSNHKVKNPFFRIEICPTKEECERWTMKDWKQCLDDAIRHLDRTDYKDKSGKVKGRHTELANSQWVATVHFDTDKPHIHLIANRITEDGRCQDSNQDAKRAIMAANAMAIERGWIKAEDVDGDRKERIHSDAIDVLRSMKAFSYQDYFDAMRAKGWIVKEKYDSYGNCVNYNIGEKLFKTNGELSSTIMLKSSSLDSKRELTPKRLKQTWQRLHKNQANTQPVQKPVAPVQTPIQPKPVVVPRPAPIAEPVRRPSTPVTPAIPVWACSEYEAREQWRDKGSMVRIPDFAADIISREVPAIDPMDYKDPNSDIPTRPDIIASAIFEFLVAADAQISGGGGGGGSSNDLRWDGKTKDDLENMAKGAAHSAFAKSTAGLRKRGGLSR